MFDAKKIKDDIVNWIKIYFENNASPHTKAVIGISGGKDSSIVAALCAEALDLQYFFCKAFAILLLSFLHTHTKNPPSVSILP